MNVHQKLATEYKTGWSHWRHPRNMAVVHELKVVWAPSDVWAREVGIFQTSALLLIWEVGVSSFMSEEHASRRHLIQERGMGRSQMGCLWPGIQLACRDLFSHWPSPDTLPTHVRGMSWYMWSQWLPEVGIWYCNSREKMIWGWGGGHLWIYIVLVNVFDFKMISLYFLHLVWGQVIHMSEHMCGSQATTYASWFSRPSPCGFWDFRSSGSAASAFVHWAISLAPKNLISKSIFG